MEKSAFSLYIIFYMDTYCRKYGEQVPEETPDKRVECRHPGDYCKFRTSCIVFFLSRDDEVNRAEETEASADRELS